MSTNGDRIAAYEAFKRKHAPEYLPRIDHRDDIWRIPLVVCAIVLTCAIAFGIWQHVTRPDVPWAYQVARECLDEGKTPVFIHDAVDHHVLTVRCDVARP